ncbi:MAG: translational GTPase TypA [Parachlamydiales bacterium]|jgi:GTP-binding protein
MYHPKKIRNVAIIAHIDHGKTTLVDCLLKQGNIFRDNAKVLERVMDSNAQERERGITIYSKQTCIHIDDYKINIIDTPGHADFSGEVERILGTVNSVLLLVDAQEGPMPQTRFVLMKSLRMGLNPIVIINKIDRPHADPDRVLNETFDLFTELGATDEQLDFSYCYASGLGGYAVLDPAEKPVDMRPLLQLIIDKVPAPSGDPDEPFLMQITTVGFDEYVGRLVCGRVRQGKISKGQPLLHISATDQKRSNVTRIEVAHGLEMVEMNEAGVGDIITLAGFPTATIGDTLCDPNNPIQLPPITLDAPTVSVDICVNNSPFVGKSGQHVTMNKIRDRLEKEKRSNISLNISADTSDQDKITVAGRGELHLAVLIEQMRREGYEFSLSKPKVITREEDGVLMEPMERVHVDVPEEYSGSIIEQLSKRKGEMQSLETTAEGMTRMIFVIPMRGLIGYRNEFLTMTRGLGVLTSLFEGYAPWKGNIGGKNRGALIAGSGGPSTAYSLWNLQDRGTLFVGPGDDVYEGMVVGEHSRENDLIVNTTKGKQLTNVRAAGSDENIMLIPPLRLTLEQAIDYIREDEYVEVTPDAVRLRKKYLTENERKRLDRKK